MKIKIIDLLNKIANDEEVPKKIKYNNETFTIREEKDDYANQNYWFTDRFCLLDLNDEIEVIEDTPKKIEKLEPVRGSDLSDLTDKDMVLKNNALIELCKTLNNMNNKINELIDEINNLKDK